MKELVCELHRRFPLLRQLRVADDREPAGAPVPEFLGLLLATATSETRDSCAFVLPEAKRYAFLATVLLALSRLRETFPSLVADYAKSALRVGQRVRVLPTGHVYEYGGLMTGCEHLFRLKMLSAGDRRTNASRSLPVREVLRLEPTERKTPQGTGATDLGTFQLSPLDGLLEIATGGNKSLFRNYVLYLSPRGEFEALMRSLAGHRVDTGDYHGPNGAVLAEILPWGWLTEKGNFESADQYQTVGAPLIAVTMRVDHLAEICERLSPFCVTVIVDEPERLISNLQGYDRIARRQKLLIFSTHGDAEKLQVLLDRGCKVWAPTAEELVLSDPIHDRIQRPGYIGRLFRGVDNFRRLEVKSLPCSNQALQAVADRWGGMARAVDKAEDEGLRRTAGQLLSILVMTADLYTAPDSRTIENVRSTLSAVRRDLAQQRPWHSEITSALEEACSRLNLIFDEPEAIGESKRRELLRLLEHLKANDGRRLLIVTRLSWTATGLAEWLAGVGHRLAVLPIQNVTPDLEADAIIACSWPNSVRFGALLDLCLAPLVYVVAYEFEARWVEQYRIRRERQRSRMVVSTRDRSALAAIEERLLSNGFGGSKAVLSQQLMPATDDLPLLTLETLLRGQRKGDRAEITGRQDMRQARYVDFTGPTYAYLSEWHVIPVVTGLVDEGRPLQPSVVMKTVNELRPGDIAIFRESGESDVIRIIAEDSIGKRTYAECRAAAARWKDTLARLGTDPSEVRRLLSSQGVQRTEQTIRNWMYDPEQIGPAELRDLEAIARAAGDRAFEAGRDEVWTAISRLRALHREAGSRLTSLLLKDIPKGVGAIGARETLVDLVVGKVWLVRVEEIGRDFEAYPSPQVNRLLWDQGSRLLWD